MVQIHALLKNSTLSITAKDRGSNSTDFVTFVWQTMLVLAVAAVTALILLVTPPPFAVQLQTALHERNLGEESAPVTATAATKPTTNAHAKQQQSVANWLAKRYRVTNDAAQLFVSAAYQTAKEFKLDPLLILSVMAIESGLNPFAESPVGAQGLMQVMSKIHQDKFDDLGAGPKAALNPVANIRVGTQILKEYVTRSGSVEAGLKMYVGAALAENDGGYGNKVLAEYKRLKDVSDGKFVPIFTTAKALVATAKTKTKLNATETMTVEVSEPVNETQHETEQLAET